MSTYENLLVGIAGRYGARQFEQAVTQCAFPMVDVCNDAKVPVPFNGNCGDALL